MASIIIDEQSFVFTMLFAKEKSIWPRPIPTPTSGGETSGTLYPPSTGGGLIGVEGGPPAPAPPPTPPPGAITAEGVLKAALAELWEKARKAKFAQV